MIYLLKAIFISSGCLFWGGIVTAISINQPYLEVAEGLTWQTSGYEFCPYCSKRIDEREESNE